MIPPRYAVILVALVWPQAPAPNAQSKAEPNAPAETAKTLAGFFFRGDGYVDSSLEIHPDGRFSYDWSADDGGRLRQEGTIELAGGLMTLRAGKQESNRPGQVVHPPYRPIRWGDRLYLLKEKDFPRFCSHVNMGVEPRTAILGPFYMRMPKEEIAKEEAKHEFAKTAGAPAVPEPWRGRLLKKPLQGKIVEVLDKSRARVDIGSDDGLTKDIALFTAEVTGTEDDPHIAKLAVDELEPKRCIVTVDRSRWIFGVPALEKGQKITSRIPQQIVDVLFGDSP